MNKLELSSPNQINLLDLTLNYSDVLQVTLWDSEVLGHEKKIFSGSAQEAGFMTLTAFNENSGADIKCVIPNINKPLPEKKCAVSTFRLVDCLVADPSPLFSDPR